MRLGGNAYVPNPLDESRLAREWGYGSWASKTGPVSLSMGGVGHGQWAAETAMGGFPGWQRRISVGGGDAAPKYASPAPAPAPDPRTVRASGLYVGGGTTGLELQNPLLQYSEIDRKLMQGGNSAYDQLSGYVSGTGQRPRDSYFGLSNPSGGGQ